MGFNKVYKSLLEVFPQIDSRALRAVAIEHSKDADAAVQAVLVEIIPFFTERSRPSSNVPFTTRSISVEKSSEDLTDTTQTVDGTSHNKVGSVEGKTDYDANSGKLHSLHDADDGAHEPFYDAYDENHEREDNNNNNDELTLSIYTEKPQEQNLQEDVGVNQDINVVPQTEVYVQLETEFGNSTDNKSNQGKSCADGNNSLVGPTPWSVYDLSTSPFESSAEKVEASLSSDTGFKMEATSKVVGTKDESTLIAAMSQNSQLHTINILEKVTEDARNSKKTLFSAMESVVSLMRDVEIKEMTAEQTKLQAKLREFEIQVKVQELQLRLQHAKEANDMHAGEVYGETAILATELKELQSCLLSLSDERDKALAVLDEMRQILEVRLATAENEIKYAEQEKLQKPMAATKTLDNLELFMGKMEQESNILKQQAEDNAKLQQFLMDRGRVVDLLQGEIAVICQDVNLLKEKFDEHVPVSKSLSTNQTSFILASPTSSSFKSLVPDQVEPVPEKAHLLDIQKKKDASDQQSSEEKAARDYRKALQDDGWEFYENAEIYA